MPAAALGGAGEGAKTQENQSNAKTGARGAKGQGGLSPARALPGNLPNTSKAATLEPKSSDTIDNIGTKAREVPAWWLADLREDQEHSRQDEDHKTESPS